MTAVDDRAAARRLAARDLVPWWYNGLRDNLIRWMVKCCDDCGQPAAFHEDGECPIDGYRDWLTTCPDAAGPRATGRGDDRDPAR